MRSLQPPHPPAKISGIHGSPFSTAASLLVLLVDWTTSDTCASFISQVSGMQQEASCLDSSATDCIRLPQTSANSTHDGQNFVVTRTKETRKMRPSADPTCRECSPGSMTALCNAAGNAMVLNSEPGHGKAKLAADVLRLKLYKPQYT